MNIRTAAVALILALAPLAGFAPMASAETPDRQDDVIAVDYEEVSDYMWENLLDLGYTGVQDDGAERLYVPRDVAVDVCGTDTDCQFSWDAPATGLERDNVEERAELGGCETVGLVTNEDFTCADLRPVAIEWSSVDEATWTRLLDLGYVGQAGDDMEALYVPADLARTLGVQA
jgi:hypothetical protein